MPVSFAPNQSPLHSTTTRSNAPSGTARKRDNRFGFGEVQVLHNHETEATHEQPDHEADRQMKSGADHCQPMSMFQHRP